MTGQYPEPFQKLWDRFIAAAQSNPEWWKEYVRENIEAHPLPYHKNMGLSEEEYREMTALSKKQSLVPLRTVQLNVIHHQDGTILLASPDIPSLSNGISFSLTDSTVSTPLGNFSHPEVVEMIGEGEGGIFGQYVGYRWYHSEGSVETGRGLEFDLILLQQLIGRKNFLHYRGTTLTDSVVTEQFEIIVELSGG